MSNFLMSLLIVLSLNLGKPSHGASKFGFPLSRWRVTIMNEQTQGDLLLRCMSKDTNLGVHSLRVGEQFSWPFKENLWRTTLFWCDFKSAFLNSHASFQVFWPESRHWLADRCNNTNCIWAAGDGGFYLKNIPQNTFEFQHPWTLGLN